MNKTHFGVHLRDKLFPGEDAYFKQNTHVTGMAAEDNSVIINPYSNLSPENRDSVIKNEAARVFLRQRNLVPSFGVTEEQRRRFKGTSYADNEKDLRATIAARIYAGDPSAGQATPEQHAFVQRHLTQDPAASEKDTSMFQTLGPIMQRAVPLLQELSRGGQRFGAASMRMPEAPGLEGPAAALPPQVNGGVPQPAPRDTDYVNGKQRSAPASFEERWVPPTPNHPAPLAGAPKITPAPFGLGSTGPGKMAPIDWSGRSRETQETGNDQNPFPTPVGQQTGNDQVPFPKPMGTAQATGNNGNPFPMPQNGNPFPSFFNPQVG